MLSLGRGDRPGSPFGRSRHTTPHTSQRRGTRSQSWTWGPSLAQPSLTPSPLDLGYQTLEHSFCETGESSTSDSPLRDPRLEPGVTGRSQERTQLCPLLGLPDTALLHLLRLLPSRELARLGSTCRRLQQLCWTEELWSCVVLAGEAALDTDQAVRSILSRLVWAGREGRPAQGVTTVLLGGCSRSSYSGSWPPVTPPAG